jgi:hypothetical protein
MTEESTKVNTITTRNKEMESTLGLMVVSIKDSGGTVNNTEKALSSFQIKLLRKVYGKMELEYNI